jgi:hypothetical protein
MFSLCCVFTSRCLVIDPNNVLAPTFTKVKVKVMIIMIIRIVCLAHYYQKVAGLFMWGVLSDERTCL